MKSLVVTLAGLFLAGSAFAADNGSSSFLFQAPKENGHLINLTYVPYSDMKADTYTSGTKTGSLDNKPAIFDLSYLYGISNSFAVGADTTFGTVTNTNTPNGGSGTDSKLTGMGDLNVWAVANSDAGWSFLRYGGYLGISPGNAKGVNGAGALQDGNRYSGGMSLKPYVAAEWGGNGNTSYGVALSYLYMMDRKADDYAVTSVQSTLKGGNTLGIKPYVEIPFSGGMASVYGEYAMIGSQTVTTSNVDTNYDAYTSMTLGAQAKYDFTPTVAGRVGLAYVSQTDRPDVTTQKTNVTGMQADIGAVFNY